MAGPQPETRPPDTMQRAVEPDEALARRNLLWAWSLVALFLVLFGGTFGVGFVYLWLG
ncbi:MAG TPA: hypothetical protein VFB42_03890 [Gaiellaceae bacterium]|nr:hypothetical protein [Gaiellaceae bacterium]